MDPRIPLTPVEGMDAPPVVLVRQGVKPAWTPAERFAPVLSRAVFRTRWLDSYATPCHSHGRSF